MGCTPGGYQETAVIPEGTVVLDAGDGVARCWVCRVLRWFLGDSACDEHVGNLQTDIFYSVWDISVEDAGKS
jgi:hypothetical protein